MFHHGAVRPKVQNGELRSEKASSHCALRNSQAPFTLCPSMRVLWICGLPYEVQERVLGGQNHGAGAAWSWVLGHLPPPEGVELHIACRTSRHTSAREFDYRGARFHLVPVRTRARVLCLFQFDWRYFRGLVARLQPDVVHGWGTEDAYSLVAIKLAPERHVVQIQGCVNACRARSKMHWVTRFSAASERMALTRARHVVAENEYSLSLARPMTRTQSLHVVEHPLRNDFLAAPPTCGDAKQVLYVGVIDERKGIWDALEAFRQAAPPEWRMTVVGTGRPGVLAELRRRMAANELAARVTHLPQVDAGRIVELMQASSIFLLPTWVDTGPTALKEALAMGLWPVCYDNSGPSHYIRQFHFGTLAEDRNLGTLGECLKQAIAGEPWKQDVHRSKIESEIRPHFQRARIWEDLLRLYRHVCASAS